MPFWEEERNLSFTSEEMEGAVKNRLVSASGELNKDKTREGRGLRFRNRLDANALSKISAERESTGINTFEGVVDCAESLRKERRTGLEAAEAGKSRTLLTSGITSLARWNMEETSGCGLSRSEIAETREPCEDEEELE